MRSRLLLFVFIFVYFGFLFSAGKPIFKEITHKRTKFSKTIQTDRDKYKLVFFNHPRHFRNAYGTWQEIDPEFLPYKTGYANFTNTIKSIVDLNGVSLGSEEPVIFKDFSLSKNNAYYPLIDQVKSQSRQSLSLNSSGKFNVISDYGKIRFEIDANNGNQIVFDLKLAAGWSAQKYGRRILIKNRENANVYTLSIPQFKTSSGIITPGDYIINQTNDGSRVTVNVPENINSNENFQLTIEVTDGYEPDELTIGGVQKYYVNNNLSGSASYSGSNVGRWIESDTSYYTYRAYQYFDISDISSTAEIDSAKYKFTFSNSSQNFTVNLQQMSKNYQSTPGILWDDCEDGNNYGSFSSNVTGVYSEKYESWDSFCGDIKDNIGDGWFGIGFYTSDSPDEYITIFSGVDTSLIIYYHDPQEYFDFNVDYDFGTGYVTINDLFGSRNESIPYNNAYQYGNTVEVTAHNQQGGDYFRVFEKWIRNIGTNPQESIADSASSVDVKDSIKYQGKFNRRFNFSAQNDFIDGGAGGELIVDGVSEGAPYFQYFIEHVSQPFEIEAPDQPLSVNNRTVDYFFTLWDDGSTSNPRTFSPTDHDSAKAVYKGHLASSTPDLSNSKNQRRLLMDGNYWVMIYEDAGDIWLTWSLDEGESWQKEVRLNMRKGYAFHPTLSNAVWGGMDHYMAAWLEENSSGNIELHLQTMRMPNTFGWSGSPYTPQTDGLNHRIFDDNSSGIPRSDSYPFLHLERINNNDDILLTLASECQNTGIRSSKILFEEDGPGGEVCDLEDAEAQNEGIGFPSIHVPEGHLGFTYEISSSTNDRYPLVLHVPPSYGSSSKTYVYYAKCNTTQIYQHDLDTHSNSYTTLPSEFNGIFSLQGAACADNATIALAVRTSSYIGGANVAIFERPSYGGMPQLTDVYRDYGVAYSKPTIMIHEYGGFNSSGADYTVMMEQNNGTFYKSNGSVMSLIGSDIAGVYSRELAPSGDQRAMAAKYTAPPILYTKYSGSGTLNKSVSSNVSIAVYRYWTDGNLVKKTVLDFKKVHINVVDSLQKSDVLAAVQVFTNSLTDTVVQQPDSILTPLTVCVFRGGHIISSFTNKNWQSITGKQLPALLNGDILLFKLRKKFKPLWSFNEIRGINTLLDKNSSPNISFEKFIPDRFNLTVYPNPFNPVTTIQYDLPQDCRLHLAIYNINGKKISELANTIKQAGSYKIRFDGTQISSGIYFLRLQAGNVVQTKRMLLVK